MSAVITVLFTLNRVLNETQHNIVCSGRVSVFIFAGILTVEGASLSPGKEVLSIVLTYLRLFIVCHQGSVSLVDCANTVLANNLVHIG